MPAKANLTKAANITANVREIDFVSSFAQSWKNLQQIWGIMRPIKKDPGSILKAYTASVTLQSGSVGEGEEIPYSLASVVEAAKTDLSLLKYAKAVSIEAVNKYGAEIAVERTDKAFLDQLQSKVMNDFYTFLATGTLTATKSTFQAAFAHAVGAVKNKWDAMDREAGGVTAFCNIMDAYAYLGAASLSVQTAFGIDYVKNFMGADTVILTSKVASGKVIATPTSNIVAYYIDPGDSQFAELGLNYTVDGELPLIGFSTQGNYQTAVGECFALMGFVLWAEYLDGIAVVTVNP